MCAQYLIYAGRKQLLSIFNLSLPPDLDEIDLRIAPFQISPVIVEKGGEYILRPMQFSMVPSWAKERRLNFPTFNARVDSAATKATWKKPFMQKHAIVPISKFVEPIYKGDYAGNMVRFFDKNHELFLAAAIYDEWIDKKTGEVVESFALLTKDASSFVDKIGHDRSPVFLTSEGAKKWLQASNIEGSADRRSASDFVQLLKAHEAPLNLAVEVDRPMKNGWQKRVSSTRH